MMTKAKHPSTWKLDTTKDTLGYRVIPGTEGLHMIDRSGSVLSRRHLFADEMACAAVWHDEDRESIAVPPDGHEMALLFDNDKLFAPDNRQLKLHSRQPGESLLELPC